MSTRCRIGIAALAVLVIAFVLVPAAGPLRSQASALPPSVESQEPDFGVGHGAALTSETSRGNLEGTAQAALTCAEGSYYDCATALTVGVSKNGYASTAKSVYYKITAQAGSSYTVQVTPNTGDPNLSVYSPSLQKLASAAQVGFKLEKVAFTAVVGGDYYIVVTAASSSGYFVLVNTTTLSSITVSGASQKLIVGGTKALTATAAYSTGETANVSAYAEWQSNDTAVATVDTAGKLTGVGIGTTTVTAGLSSVSGNYPVTAYAVTALNVTPASVTLAKDFTTNLVAKATLSDRTVQTVTTTAQWSSSDPTVASVTTSGQVKGLKPGTAAIAVGYYGTQVTVPVTVMGPTSLQVSPSDPWVAVGWTTELKVSATYPDGSTKDVTSKAAWSSSTTGATVSSGWVTGVAVGAPVIQATYSGLAATTTVNVATVTAFTVTPTSSTLLMNESIDLIATATFTGGAKADVTPFADWTCTQTVATCFYGWVVPAGLGSTNVTARYGSLAKSVAIKVAEISTFTVTPATFSVPIGTGKQMTATVKYTDLSTENVTALTEWLSGDPAIATVSPTGYVTAIAPGTVTIEGYYKGWQSVARMTVTCSAGSGIDRTCAISLGATAQTGTLTNGNSVWYKFTATGGQTTTIMMTPTSADADLYVYGPAPDYESLSNTWSGGAAPEWTTVHPDVTGEYYAQVEGHGTTPFKIEKVTLSSIGIAAASNVVAVGESIALTVTATYSNGTTVDVSGDVSWSGYNSNLVRVGGWSEVTGLAPGTTTLTGQFQNKSATYSVTVGTLQAVSISPASPSIMYGETQQMVATAIYADTPSTKDVTSQTWWRSDNPDVASISDSEGLVLANKPGFTEISATYMGMVGTTMVTVTCEAGAYFTCAQPFTDIINGTLKVDQVVYHKFSASSGNSYSLTLTTDTGEAGFCVHNPQYESVLCADSVGSTKAQAFLRPGQTGDYYVEVTAGSAAGNYTLSLVPLQALSLDGGSVTMEVGGADMLLAATAWYDGAVSQDVTCSAAWTSSTAVVTVDQCGRVNAVKGGNTTITVSYGGQSATRPITVVPVLTGIEISPTALMMKVGDTSTVTVTGLYNDGTSRPITPESMSTDNSWVATVNPYSGTVNAWAEGTTTIRADQGPYQAFASVTVSPNVPTLTRVRVEAGSILQYTGKTVQFRAYAVYSNGQETDVTAAATWSSTGPVIVSNAGSVTGGAMSGGNWASATVIATYGSQQGSLPVTVYALTNLWLEPPSPIMGSDEVLQLTLWAEFGDGAWDDVTLLATGWSSTSPDVARLESTASQIRSWLPGTTTISADYGGRTATLIVTVACQVNCPLSTDPVPETQATPTTPPVSHEALTTDLLPPATLVAPAADQTPSEEL